MDATLISKYLLGYKNVLLFTVGDTNKISNIVSILRNLDKEFLFKILLYKKPKVKFWLWECLKESIKRSQLLA